MKTAFLITLAIGAGIAVIAVVNTFVTIPLLSGAGKPAGTPTATGSVAFDARQAVKSEEN